MENLRSFGLLDFFPLNSSKLFGDFYAMSCNTAFRKTIF
jgi:hypothetical protein